MSRPPCVSCASTSDVRGRAACQVDFLVDLIFLIDVVRSRPWSHCRPTLRATPSDPPPPRMASPCSSRRGWSLRVQVLTAHTAFYKYSPDGILVLVDDLTEARRPLRATRPAPRAAAAFSRCAPQRLPRRAVPSGPCAASPRMRSPFKSDFKISGDREDVASSAASAGGQIRANYFGSRGFVLDILGVRPHPPFFVLIGHAASLTPY
jgi:hypothetical protein